MTKNIFDGIGDISSHIKEVLDTMTDGIFISNGHGTTLFVNKAYEQLSGHSAQGLCGKNILTLKEQGVFDTALNPIIVATKKPASTVQLLGNTRVTLHGFPILENNKVVLVVTFVRDITMISRLQDQVSQQKELIDDYHERISFISAEQNKITESELFQSKAMQDLLVRLQKYAKTDVSILLIGETGTGKDVLARLVHSMSARSNKVFLKVDCSSISENLIESELFGYTPGAFSGAVSKGKPGYFEAADGGTIMLDEIGELPLSMQAKFLRVLQDFEIIRVGANTPRKVDIRIIAATNVNLRQAVKQGTFREDLYYRLNVATLHVPPLRERRADIRPFLFYFLKMYTAKYHHRVELDGDTLDVLENYSWPGNVRELQNLVQSLVVAREKGVIYPKHLPPHISGGSKAKSSFTYVFPDEQLPLRDIVAEFEKELLQAQIAQLGSANKAAEFFHINRSTLFRKLSK